MLNEVEMSEFKQLTDDNFETTISSNDVVLVDFYASWCGGCRMAAPMFLRVAGQAGLDIYKLDVEANPKVKAMLSLPGLPSVAIFKAGEPIDLINTTKEDVFSDFLKKNGLLK
jgi:thioredoxin 1